MQVLVVPPPECESTESSRGFEWPDEKFLNFQLKMQCFIHFYCKKQPEYGLCTGVENLAMGLNSQPPLTELTRTLPSQLRCCGGLNTRPVFGLFMELRPASRTKYWESTHLHFMAPYTGCGWPRSRRRCCSHTAPPTAGASAVEAITTSKASERRDSTVLIVHTRPHTAQNLATVDQYRALDKTADRSGPHVSLEEQTMHLATFSTFAPCQLLQIKVQELIRIKFSGWCTMLKDWKPTVLRFHWSKCFGSNLDKCKWPHYLMVLLGKRKLSVFPNV